MNINNRKCVAWFALGATIFATVAFMLGSTHFNTNQFSFSTGSGTPKAWIKDGALLTNTSIRGLTLPAGLLISGYDGVDGYVWTRTNANGSGHWAPAGAGGGASNAVAEINGGTNAQQWFEIANSGTDVTITTTAVGSKATNKINIPTASAVNRGVVSSADWSTFAGKQASNAALASLAAHGAVTNLNGLDGDSQTLATGTGGSDFAIASAGTAHTFNLPTASAVNRGALSAADWAAFAAKQASNANTAAWANVGTNQFARTNELQTGKTLLVDAVFGNDTTAKRENGKPFATLSNAVAVAQTWDTIKVRSGYHYGTTTLTMPIGVHLIGEGKEATIIHIERFNTGHAIGMKASNYFGSFTIITTNYDNNTYTVPFDGANLTNVVFENVRCSGYYDNWKIAGNGRATIKFFNCESFAAYDSFNVTANTNCTLEFYGGRYLSDFTLGGAVTPFDCRVIAASFSARIRAYGTSFEARNYAVAQAFQVYPTFLDSPPGRSLQDVDVQLFGCKIYSDGTAIRNMEDLYNEAVEVTNALPSGIYRLDGCQVVGEIRGPVWGSFTGSNFVNVGHANAFSTATDGGFVVSAYPPGHSGFIVGVSNLLTTNGGIVGFNLTNPANNTLDIGVSNATKTTFSHNGVTVRSPLTVNNALSAQNLQVGSATITESIITFADGATITETAPGVIEIPGLVGGGGGTGIATNNGSGTNNTFTSPTFLGTLTGSGTTPGKLSLGTNNQFVTWGASSDGGMMLGNTNQFVLNSTNGFVGIGTTNPLAKLQVRTASGGSMYLDDVGGGYTGIRFVDTAAAGNYAFLGAATGDNDTYFNRPSTGIMHFRENNSSSDHMTIASGGNVGIGTNVPQADLHVVAQASNTVPVRIQAAPVTAPGASNLTEWVSADGTTLLAVKTNGSISLPTGSLNHPALILANSDDGTGTGLYYADASAPLAFAVNGVTVAAANGNGVSVAGGLQFDSMSSGAGMSLAGGGTGSGNNIIFTQGGVRKDVVIATGNSISPRALWCGSATNLTAATATAMFNIALANSKIMGVNCFITVTANDGTDFQSKSAEVSFDAVNKAGTLTIGTVNVRENATAASSGTLTATYTAVAVGGNSVDVKVEAASSLTETVLTAWVTILSINTDGTATVSR